MTEKLLLLQKLSNWGVGTLIPLRPTRKSITAVAEERSILKKLVILTALTVTLRRETANPAPKDTI